MSQQTEYSPEVASKICARISAGESVRKISADDAMPAQSTIYRWLADQPEFSEQYARAREAQADTIFDQIIEIADGSSGDVLVSGDGPDRCNTEFVQRSRLRVDARKWVASKLAPKKYGDKIEHSGTLNVRNASELSDDDLAAIAGGRGTGAATTPSDPGKPG